MSLPQAIKTMLENNISSVLAANITYGTRNQFATFPAITYTISNNETISIGSAPQHKCEITVRSVAQTAEDAQDIGEDVEAALVTGTFNTIAFNAVINKNSMLEENNSGFGDETLPFICVTTADIYYKD
jgi:hypothetical protein